MINGPEAGIIFKKGPFIKKEYTDSQSSSGCRGGRGGSGRWPSA